MMSERDDMTQSQDPRPVTQQDRDAAAGLLACQGKPKLYTDEVRDGMHDNGPTVQWFAALSRPQQEASGEVRGAWSAFDQVLSMLNGLHVEELTADQMRRKIYGEVMSMRPALSAQPLADAGDVERVISAAIEDVFQISLEPGVGAIRTWELLRKIPKEVAAALARPDRMAEMEAALRPFAALADRFSRVAMVEICEPHPGNPSPEIEPLPVKAFHDARAALSGSDDNNFNTKEGK